jgi:AAA15 family ATPase/GTPase
MIRKFGVKNFTSFKEGIDLDFTFNKNVPEQIRNNSDCSPIIGIKGSNGSGKTNIIKAITFLFDFCARSAEKKNDEPINFDTFFRSEESTEFYIEFDTEKYTYYYELTLTTNKVISETIYDITNIKQKLLDRKNSKLVYYCKEFQELKNVKLRDNASIISQITQFSFNSPMSGLKRIETFFRYIISNVHASLGFSDFLFDYEGISKQYLDNPKLFSFVKHTLQLADSGIDDIQISDRKDESGKKIYFPIFFHNYGGEERSITFMEESKGTQTLYQKLYHYWIVLASGGILALDEFDVHMHAMLLPELLKFFEDKVWNPHNAQLIFTAHNTEIIDTLGKYRTVLVNKEQNESYCYRLDEIPGSMVRNDRAITPLYLQGKIGGVPSFEKISK